MFLFKYEDYVDHNFDLLEDFLGVRIESDTKVLKQFHRVIRGNAHRFWRHSFTKRDKEHYRPLFQPFLERYGYADDWLLENPRKINPDHCSHNVRRIINERRKAEDLTPVA